MDFNLRVPKVKSNQKDEFLDLQKKVFLDSYYTKINYPITIKDITDRDFFLIFNNMKVGILRVGNSLEFDGKFGIGLIGILPEYREKGVMKQAISFCKRLAKRKNINEILAYVPCEAKDLINIFEKCGFIKQEIRTTVGFPDCFFVYLTDSQLSHLNLNSANYFFKWQKLCLKVL